MKPYDTLDLIYNHVISQIFFFFFFFFLMWISQLFASLSQTKYINGLFGWNEEGGEVE